MLLAFTHLSISFNFEIELVVVVVVGFDVESVLLLLHFVAGVLRGSGEDDGFVAMFNNSMLCFVLLLTQ